jgi:hypothetical protein
MNLTVVGLEEKVKQGIEICINSVIDLEGVSQGAPNAGMLCGPGGSSIAHKIDLLKLPRNK